jgi:hypothetical protein
MDMGVTVDGVGVELLLMKLISKYIVILVLCWDSYKGWICVIIAYMPTLERLKAVEGLGFATLCHAPPPPRKLFFRRTQNGAFCCILDIKSVQSNL